MNDKFKKKLDQTKAKFKKYAPELIRFGLVFATAYATAIVVFEKQKSDLKKSIEEADSNAEKVIRVTKEDHEFMIETGHGLEYPHLEHETYVVHIEDTAVYV